MSKVAKPIVDEAEAKAKAKETRKRLSACKTNRPMPRKRPSLPPTLGLRWWIADSIRGVG